MNRLDGETFGRMTMRKYGYAITREGVWFMDTTGSSHLDRWSKVVRDAVVTALLFVATYYLTYHALDAVAGWVHRGGI